MARAQVKDGTLRGCPLCGTPVTDVELRLRDFSWANESLPGAVGGMDVDFVLGHAKTGMFLTIEMKPPHAYVSRGARLTYRELVKTGVFDCWVAWGPDDEGNVQRGYFDRGGRIQRVETMTLDELADDVGLWWACREEAECA